MLEWNMGGNFNFIEQYLTFCARIHRTFNQTGSGE
jgi:hypothetical protein